MPQPRTARVLIPIVEAGADVVVPVRRNVIRAVPVAPLAG